MRWIASVLLLMLPACGQNAKERKGATKRTSKL